MREETRQFLKVISLLSDNQMGELQDNLKALSSDGTKKVERDILNFILKHMIKRIKNL